MYNNRYTNQNDRGQNNQHRRFRTNPSVNAENDKFDFKSSKQTERSQPSSSNTKEQWRKQQKSPNRQERWGKNQNFGNRQENWRPQYNSENRQEQLNFKQNSENRQDRWGGKKIEQNEYPDNGTTENKIINKYSFGFKRLEELCSKDPSEIVFVMSNKVNGFMDLFKQNKEPDWIFLLMKVSAKICSTELIQSKTFLLTELICNQFFDHLKTYILSTPTEKNLNRCNNMNIFYEDCLVVFLSITTLFPKTAEEKLKEIIVSSNIALNGIKSYCNHIKINKTTVVKMNELLDKLNATVLTEELKLKEKLVIENIAQLMPPPENFRELTVYPTAIDLECGERFLRPNISKGAYQNVEHYLDVQFRLLREDFIAPLREGIQFYKETINDERQHQRRKKINNIRIYCDIEFEKKGEFVRDKYGYLVNFDKKKKLRINWEMAKRFMYGSLLLFSENHFKTFFLGIVLERKIELLTQGKLIVELLEDEKPIFNTSLTMVESEVFFEPYKCSMEVLKNINSHSFPMEKYIISACNKIDYPYYIDMLPELTYYEIDKLAKFQVLSQNQWPTKEQLGLDEMQFGAFRAALTHEFTVIQGPPGTGKTFIGLKIMKTIINNLYDKPFLTKPILVVCYTNHALDQFMEGILSFTNKVIRIGGQSKSEIIEKYSLRNISRMYRRSITTNRGLQNIGDQVKTTMENIKYFKKCSEVVSYNAGILELSLLKNGMPKQYHNFFKTTLDLLSWLFQDFDYFSVDPIGFITGISNELINRVYNSEQLLEIKNEVVEDDDEEKRYEPDYLDLEHNNKDIVIYSITLDDIKNACKELLEESMRLENLSNKSVHFFNESEEAKFNFGVMEKVHDYFEYMLNLIDTDIELPRTIKDIYVLNMRQRWSLYFSWVKETKEMFNPKIIDYEQKYTQVYKQYAELRELENVELLNKMHVIALTTTGAAKHRIMLEGLESPIVVVEEAAEVLEAHIVSSLTSHCQHLILIGDHKQLRPSNAVYKLAKDFNFDISLFERMVNNEVPCYTLGEQHRMRPEIASLITPSIYNELKNHISVHNREHIRGVTKDVFFLNHNLYENEVEEISSKSNDHEARFLIMFARHLILQGYKTDQVTILTTYSGQLFQIRSLRKKHAILEGMKITVVDNYQGEESDIILLSLVRSNEKGNVGFLKTENRICVALSRAKYGLYIMGNMDNLYNSGNLWKQIKETLVNQGSYGDELTLECAVHSGIMTKVAKSEDFNIIMEGGCSMLCKSLLLCGHYCSSVCHSYDRDHLELKCREPCNKFCDYNHPCKKTCYMDCGDCLVLLNKELPCGHELTLRCFVDVLTYPCEEMVKVFLEICGHTIFKKCHDKKPICSYKCIDRLDCGHACEKNCHKDDDPDHEEYKCLKPCANINKMCSLSHKCQKMCYEDCSLCTVKIKKVLPCGHTKNDVPCGLNINDIKCILPCTRKLACVHKCQSKCYEKCKPCENQVVKVIPDCGHSITMKCKTLPERKLCTKKCNRILACGHMCKNLCAEECTTKDCEEIVLQKNSKLACGHNQVWVLCCDKDKEFRLDSQYLLDKCREPCLQKLNCNDICLGTCGECKQGRIHVPCSEICNKINPCNHTCKFPCKERCPPCNQKCIYSCVHSRCTRLCGVPCVRCKEKCEWKCPHLKCTRKCFELCNRHPCYEPCKFKLNCGHDCIGFCGEPCPPLCRICQEDEVTTIVFGNEDEPNARFVYLEDCEHTIESEALTQWMNQNDEEICLKQCPLCKTPILKTQRFMNQVKVILEDISNIKTKQYGELSVIRGNTKTIINSLKSLNNNFFSYYICDTNHRYHRIKNLWDTFCKPLLVSLNNKRSKFSLPAKDIESLHFVIDLFKSTSKYKNRIQEIKDVQRKESIINHFDWILSVAFTYAQQLSNQQKFDINMEMARGARIMSLFEIMSNTKFQMAQNDLYNSYAVELKDLVGNMEALLMSCKIYTVDRDTEIQMFTELIDEKFDGLAIITDEERQMIHAAMSVNFIGGIKAQGHWCKCPNGHIYCVTECGGPMQKSVCPECKVEIGGQSHRHVSGITVASEMDGARNLMYQRPQE
ncbi:NFX1-type zinc finger-containing protein 1 [Acyrthosiphon pisum]|uniref:RZ-type domain-containing protein n=1 Tax=Acyrthosiphon pisum TaxID=7029 RepID=A0A8R2NP84_ACYPI|nr:NFX1-type zinc finger-containing protein 1 [Acyrthosiphon pisum]XP_029344239.1 NFX1-type zinc finger-containing protein 1 [Acyrthosiphon pisum]XP_029344240.1 NFX1-type zinc finger-containing protein 1 [Acyrthosiphon pisum]|eukprot:XP_001949970.2 PREDICTED: NFX1-type zinc finger-containing protein 1 isoform X1 [Acyrthosiphon pisum]